MIQSYKLCDSIIQEQASIKSCECLILEYMRWGDEAIYDIDMKSFRGRLQQKEEYIEAIEIIKKNKIKEKEQDKILSYYNNGIKIGVLDIHNKTAKAYKTTVGVIDAIISKRNWENKVALYNN